MTENRVFLLFIVFILGLVAFGVFEVVTHHTGYDDTQRTLHRCQAKGLDMVQDYSVCSLGEALTT